MTPSVTEPPIRAAGGPFASSGAIATASGIRRHGAEAWSLRCDAPVAVTGAPKFGFGASKFGFGASKFGFGASKFGFGASKFGFEASKFMFGASKFGFEASKFGFEASKFMFGASKFRFGASKFMFDASYVNFRIGSPDTGASESALATPPGRFEAEPTFRSGSVRAASSSTDRGGPR